MRLTLAIASLYTTFCGHSAASYTGYNAQATTPITHFSPADLSQIYNAMAEIGQVTHCDGYPSTTSECYPCPEGRTPFGRAVIALDNAPSPALKEFAKELRKATKLPKQGEIKYPKQVYWIIYVVKQSLSVIYASGQYPPTGPEAMELTNKFIEVLTFVDPEFLPTPGFEYFTAVMIVNTLLNNEICKQYFANNKPQIQQLHNAIQSAAVQLTNLGANIQKPLPQQTPSYGPVQLLPPRSPPVGTPNLNQVKSIVQPILNLRDAASQAFFN